MTQEMARRTFLAGGAALVLGGCAAGTGAAPDGSPPATTTPPTTATPTTTSPAKGDEPAFTDLERRFDARLGVWALDTGSGARVEHRADERFAFCSTHKVFSAAAILHANTVGALDTVVRYTRADLVAPSPISDQHVEVGMSLRDLCDAAVRYSDNTAANLLFGQIGGPPALASFLRSSGDTTTDCSRIEPDLSSAVPGDLRDTTTPRAWGQDLRAVTLGDTLPADKRAILVDWLVRNTTGRALVRAGAPAGWTVGDKTGSGHYGTRNDIAVLWPPDAAPVVLAILSSRPGEDDRYDDQLLAEAARATLTALA
jgi:beta-lactamase class A